MSEPADLEGDSIRLTPVRQRGRQMVVRDGLAVLEPIEGFVITDADIQRWRDADQR
jgi:hypothetical protein